MSKPTPGRCGVCGAAVYWVHSVKINEHGVEVVGKGTWPVNADPDPKGNVSLSSRAGQILARVSKDPVPGGRLAHKLTCEAWPKDKT